MYRELDTRTNADGDLVTLLWNEDTDSLELRVEPATGATLVARVTKERAVDAFRHPYLYVR